MSLLERSLAIAHDMGLTSVAFPLIGTGANSYPIMEVVQAMLDACSFFRQKGSPLKSVVIVVWRNAASKKQVIVN